MTKIVIADYHPIIRKGAEVLLNSVNEYSIVGRVSHGSELSKCLRKERPDILILELKIPEINGFQALRNMREEFPFTKIVIFSSHSEQIYALRSIKSGASGYIPKTASETVFLEAIKCIALGKVFLTKEIEATLKNKSVNKNSIQERYKKLSTREIEVLNLLSTGKRNKDIATLLEINEKTVSTYKTRLLKKLNVTNLAEMIHQARIFQFN
ncbi:response regulator containing a CheY-like receiver domain and an HTH DNA-binding domain [Aequorivita sublithincola DSM 14238]|uniref:Response regulator containing a CheY-like receiver domain and an HTH DNA-binding domain n=1 Tax=Aequorivita sublithincola (strain DSM 14238 / LMG 21431 / ACAM 643 / 9-3) TaxID=746697 RepID=I3YWH3_AEQSU|nr:response regulator transcription factor [Aequorivita sublithincola]AFL81341.1 response regulator containing a CheY-like receiver domain and an HTH DNA-binding domain [Aequorivita sublithincola DSM 14238]